MTGGVDELLGAAATIQVSFLRQGWRFCFIGGVAVQRWGNPRFTQDIDLTLISGFGEEQRYVDALLRQLNPRRPDTREFALSRRVLLAQTYEGIDVDIALGGLPFEERTVARASLWQVRDNVALTTCSGEDLVVHKAFAGRDLDWGDVEGILIRQHAKLDLNLIRAELQPLLELKGEPEALDRFERILAVVERRLRTER